MASRRQDRRGPAWALVLGSWAIGSACVAEASIEPVPVAEVVDLLERDCGFSACHGQGGAAGGLDLSPVISGALPPAEALVDVVACQTDLPLVAPGDPDRSWLLRKVDPSTWDEGRVAAEPHAQPPRAGCPEGGASMGMPLGSEGMDPADVDALRRWIATQDGAP